jgi:hypothetical protein
VSNRQLQLLIKLDSRAATSKWLDTAWSRRYSAGSATIAALENASQAGSLLHTSQAAIDISAKARHDGRHRQLPARAIKRHDRAAQQAGRHLHEAEQGRRRARIGREGRHAPQSSWPEITKAMPTA